MIINKTNYSYQTRSDKPNENWLDDDNYLVLDDNTELAQKVIDNYPYINLQIENGVITDILIDETRKKLDENKEEKLQEIEMLKKRLADTDYQAIKHSEGLISEEDYAPMKEQRQAWRNQINELEGEVS